MSDGFGVINWKVWHTFGTPSWWLDYHGDDNEDYDSELLMMTMLNPSEIFNVLMTVMIVNCKDYKLNWIIYLERKLPIRHFHCDDGSSFKIGRVCNPRDWVTFKIHSSRWPCNVTFISSIPTPKSIPIYSLRSCVNQHLMRLICSRLLSDIF